MPAIANTNANTDSDVISADNALTNSSAPVPLLVLVLILTLIYYFGPKIFEWRFPFQTTGQLDTLVAEIDEIIDSNSSIERDLIGPHYLHMFKAALQVLDHRVSLIKIQMCCEPGRTNPITWLLFHWSVLKDVDSCYNSLKSLECEIKTHIHVRRAVRSD
ncbi:hypothetical protein WG66_008053 [Moniliophthora roreri]|nr:hypothetical protein WG66_008053 [Moniliophthora roreri]